MPQLPKLRVVTRQEPQVNPLDRLKIMTFNLRWASDTPPNEWAVRRPAFFHLLSQEKPHLFGTQEGLYAQLNDMKADLGPKWTWIGVGRDNGTTTGEHTAIFYDTRRLSVIASGNFWLSGTPDTPGSNTWGNAFIRMCTWARFNDLRTGRNFYHYNAHLDNSNQTAREQSIDLIMDRLEAQGTPLPGIITGDMNCPAGANQVHTDLLARGYKDTWLTANFRSKAFGTFPNYGSLVLNGERIDWIFSTGNVTCHKAEIVTTALNGQYPSDHLPQTATVSIG